MITKYPFEMPANAADSIPQPNRDGYSYVDVKFRGRWDGILVLNSLRQCVGIYIGREIVEHSLPFTPDQIQQVRPASLWNRFLANLPRWLGPYDLAMLMVWIVCPILLAAGFMCTVWALLAVPLLAFVSLTMMYQVPGFPFTRFPTSILGLAQCVAAFLGLVRCGMS